MDFSLVKDKDIITKGITLLTAFGISFANYAPIPVILLFLIGIVSWKTDKRETRWNLTSIIILVFYFFSILSSLSAELPIKEISRTTFEIRLPFLLFSLAFLFSNFTHASVGEMLKWFAIGAYSSALLIIFVYIWSLCFDFDNIPYTYLNMRLCFVSVTGLILHRTYLCFNLLTALIVVFQHCLHKNTKRHLILFLSVTIFTGLFIFLSDARISLLSFCILILLFSFIYLFKKVKRAYATLISLSFIFISVYLLSLNARIHDLLVSFWSDNIDLVNLDPRFSIWHCANNILVNNDLPLFGFGTGSSQKLLYSEFIKADFVSGVQGSFGMHNQYLETLIEYGYIGLVLLFLICLSPLLNTGKNKLFFFFWTILLLINLGFESMISRSVGSYSIAFILILAGLKDDGKDTNPPTKKIFVKIFFFIIVFALFATSIKYIAIDKRDTFSGFQRYFEKVENLPGTIPVELQGKEGFRIDKTTTSEKWQNNCSTYYRFDEYNVTETDSILFSIYIYASPDFDGENIQVKLEERGIHTYSTEYDKNKKGEWQKISISRRGMTGNVFCTISVDRKDASDFSDLNGFVIFASSRIECIRNR